MSNHGIVNNQNRCIVKLRFRNNYRHTLVAYIAKALGKSFGFDNTFNAVLNCKGFEKLFNILFSLAFVGIRRAFKIENFFCIINYFILSCLPLCPSDEK